MEDIKNRPKVYLAESINPQEMLDITLEEFLENLEPKFVGELDFEITSNQLGNAFVITQGIISERDEDYFSKSNSYCMIIKLSEDVVITPRIFDVTARKQSDGILVMFTAGMSRFSNTDFVIKFRVPKKDVPFIDIEAAQVRDFLLNQILADMDKMMEAYQERFTQSFAKDFVEILRRNNETLKAMLSKDKPNEISTDFSYGTNNENL